MPSQASTVVLITGMSGTGKSTALAALAQIGWQTVDTDRGGWQIPGPDGDPVWDTRRIAALIDAVPPGGRLAMAGTVRNQGVFRQQFAAVILLTAPLGTMLQRVATRADNPYGSTEADRHAIAHDTDWVLPLLRTSADLELDSATLTPADVAARIEAFVNGTRDR